MKQQNILFSSRFTDGSRLLAGTLVLLVSLALGACGGGANTSSGGAGGGGTGLGDGGSASAGPVSCDNIPDVAPGNVDHIAAYSQTVYPLVRQYCVDCHDTGTGSPKFAHSDATNAYNQLAISQKVDLCDPAGSRLVEKLNPELHNCWGNCGQNASAMQTAITEWAARVATTGVVAAAAIQSAPANFPANAQRGENYTLSFNITQHVGVPATAPAGAQSLIQIDAMEWDDFGYLFSNPRYVVGTPMGGGTGLDGAALYTSSCEGCHGPAATTTVDDPNLDPAQDPTAIRAAIDANRGGMNVLATLSPEAETAIAEYLRGARTYYGSCAVCHGETADPTNSNSKQGATENQISTAIANNSGGNMAQFATLTNEQIRELAVFLGGVTVATDFQVVDGVDVGGVNVAGVRVAVNGRANSAGQSYGCTWVNQITCRGGIDATVAMSGEQLHRQGAIIGRVSGPVTDEFHLEFARLAGVDDIRLEAAFAPVPDAVAPAPDVGVRNFAQVNDAMASLTGVPAQNFRQNTVYSDVQQQLPNTTNIESFVSAHAVSYSKLAIEYCDAMYNNNTRRQNFYGTTNPTNQQIVDATVDKMAGVNLVSQPARQLMIDELTTMVTNLQGLGMNTSQRAKAACTAMLSSAVVQIQ
ncbi:MAG: c-type cytochrome [Pseudomonadota bacterium]|nr:MAG: c-type cytochrome [Pseudomonadota bacterium]